MFEILLSKLRGLLKNPMVLFVHTVMSKWYIIIASAGIIVAFWVFRGLTEAGVLEKFDNTLFKALKETKSIAKYCVPKITEIQDFWECLQSPPEYIENKEEEEVSQEINNLINSDKNAAENKNPYEK